jgi:hypothetical protein
LDNFWIASGLQPVDSPDTNTATCQIKIGMMHIKLSTISGLLSVLLGVMTLGPLAHTGLTLSDDQNATIMSPMNWSGLLQHNDRNDALQAERKVKIIVTAWYNAIGQGRLNHLAAIPLVLVPYLMDNNLYYQLSRFAAIPHRCAISAPTATVLKQMR